MFSLDPFSLGIILVALGFGFWFLVRFLMRRVQKPRQIKRAVKAVDNTMPAAPESDVLESREDAVLLVGQGGRLISINQRGREFFRLDEYEAANLNRLSRRIRPADTFLTLCAAEGRARFALEGRMLDGVSYRIPSMPAPLMMVSLRSAELGAGLTTVVSEQSPEALKSFLQMTQGILASLDLEETLKAILENIEKFTPADLIEISLWDEDAIPR